MADNRLFMIHKPSMLGVMIAKSYAGEYREGSVKLDTLFRYIANEGYCDDMDDFIIVNENSMNFEYDLLRDGLRQFKKVKNGETD